jgi:peptidoglycan/xylan/chitin deacetylase (PgdA/CDA1 family)
MAAILIGGGALFLYGLVALPWRAGRNGFSPLALLQPTATMTATATSSPTPTSTSTPSPTATATMTATATSTPTATATATVTSTPTRSATPSPTATPEPQPTPDGTPRTLVVPILMYHYISAPPSDADAIRRDLSVSPARFAAHLEALRARGYTTISLHDLALALQVGHPLPDNPIVLTFDDGYRDAYEHALPLLLEYGYTGTFFLVTGFIDDGRPEFVTWEQVIEMHRAGMEIGSHSYTHPDLRHRDTDYLIWQALGPREAIEARIGEPVRFFCYPAGKYDERVIQVLRSAHYWGAVTVAQDAEHHSAAMFELRRIRVHGDTTANALLAAIDYWTKPGR